MDFTIPGELLELKERTERFVREDIMPREHDPRQTPHGPAEEFRHELVKLARARGLLSPHVGTEWGGLGLDHRAKAVVFEAAGYSPLATIDSSASRKRAIWPRSAVVASRTAAYSGTRRTAAGTLLRRAPSRRTSRPTSKVCWSKCSPSS